MTMKIEFRSVPTTISFTPTIYGWSMADKMFISRSEVMGKPSRSLRSSRTTQQHSQVNTAAAQRSKAKRKQAQNGTVARTVPS